MWFDWRIRKLGSQRAAYGHIGGLINAQISCSESMYHVNTILLVTLRMKHDENIDSKQEYIYFAIECTHTQMHKYTQTLFITISCQHDAHIRPHTQMLIVPTVVTNLRGRSDMLSHCFLHFRRSNCTQESGDLSKGDSA